MDCQANHSIGCTVDQCKHHCSTEPYCSLNKITVGTHETNPTMVECTDCQSFEKKIKIHEKYPGILEYRDIFCFLFDFIPSKINDIQVS